MVKLDPFRSTEIRAQFIAKYDAVLHGWPASYEQRDVDTDAGAHPCDRQWTRVRAAADPASRRHTTSMMWRPII
jgi:hypothetical protein